MLQTAIEIKGASDDERKFQRALEKEKSQIIGRLSKLLEHDFDFDFGGIGRNDCSALLVKFPNLNAVLGIKWEKAGTLIEGGECSSFFNPAAR